MFTLREAAGALGLKKATLQTQRRNGALCATKNKHGMYLVQRAEFARYARESLGRHKGGRPRVRPQST